MDNVRWSFSMRLQHQNTQPSAHKPNSAVAAQDVNATRASALIMSDRTVAVIEGDVCTHLRLFAPQASNVSDTRPPTESYAVPPGQWAMPMGVILMNTCIRAANL